MEEPGRFICIDLKSFYASVECVMRGMDPMKENLVVADPERSEGTICLAISPAMKKLGIKNRCRVFEIPAGISYYIAEPSMQLYMEYSSRIYGIYLRYIAREDIHIYSVDEVFMDVTHYLGLYGMSARELGRMIVSDVFETTGIHATCGVGTNMYLAKVAMDIIAKHSDDYMGELTEESYRELLWDHRPLTDFWMVGRGISSRLARYGITTMRDIAGTDPAFLHRLFGINAELIMDHAWGREYAEIADIKAYVPKDNSLSRGQVLLEDYTFDEAKIIVKEMLDLMCLEMVSRDLVTESVTLTISYSDDILPPAHGTRRLDMRTNADMIIIPAVTELYEEIVVRDLPVRRVNISFNRVLREEYVQYTIFSDAETLEKDRNIQKAVISIKERYGKNSVIRGMNMEKKATGLQRNQQIGGHKSGAGRPGGIGATVYVDKDKGRRDVSDRFTGGQPLGADKS